jgi:cytochrome c oxidase assembly factor CtaG
MSAAITLAHYGLLGSAYQGPPRLTPARALTQWSIDPYVLTVAVLACACYLWGVRRVRAAGGAWPAGRIVAFVAGGAGLAVFVSSSFLAVYWPVLFYIRAFQTVLLLLAVPLFIMVGRPLSLAIAALPRHGERIKAIATGRVARLVTFPAITGFVLVITPFVLYFSPWYAAGFQSTAVRELTYLALVLPGMVFFWTLLRVDPVPREYPYLIALWVTAAEVVGDAALGLAVIADRSLIAGSYYHAVGWPYGPSLASDQVLGGGALWVLGDIIGLPFLAAVLIAMIKEDEAEAKVIDASLDEQEAASQPAAVQAADSGGQAPVAAGEPARSALWWESDPRFASRFAPVESDGSGDQ